MNVTVYLFGKLGGSYTQYPDDYSREVFSEFENNIKSPAQLMIHRHEALIYYGYLRRLSVRDKYIGIAFVFNGVMCTDITALCKLCEDNITNWIVNGDILEFDDNGDIISKVDKLYKTASEFKRLSEILSAQIVSAKLPFQKLPPTNYAVSASAVKTFNIEDDNEIFNTALHEYSNIYIYSDSTSEALKGFSDKLRRLNKENTNLKAANSKLRRQKKNMHAVVVLLLLIAVGVIALISFVNRSSEQKKQIIQLSTDKQYLQLQIKNLQGDSALLEQQLSEKTSALQECTIYIRCLRQDSIKLSQNNINLSNSLKKAQNSITSYKQTISQNNNLLQEKDKTINNLKSQITNQTTTNNTICISDVSVASCKRNKNIASDFNETIYSSNSYYIKTKIQYKCNRTGGREKLSIKLFGPSSYNSRVAFYDSATEDIYLSTSVGQSRTHTFTHLLGKAGSKLPSGGYCVEIWYDNKLVKTECFSIK